MAKPPVLPPATDEDLAEEVGEDVAAPVEIPPVVAVVGRPNVGKSTLVNRIIGRREAVVQDVPGVTRDRVSYDAIWNGRQFVVVDTGGWAPDATGMAAQIAEQAELAISAADAVVFVVDATVGTLDADEAVVRVLRRSQKPVVLAANKVDDQRTEAEAAAMWNLGLGEPYPVSALHGRGSGDLLDAILDALPEAPVETDGTGRRTAPGGHRRQAERRQVEPAEQAGPGVSAWWSTMSPAPPSIRWTSWSRSTARSTASSTPPGSGVASRRRSGHEYYASLRTHGAIERAEVCVVVIDASEPVTEQDLRILTSVEEAGRALLIAFNKWDLTDDERRRYLTREIERDLVQFAWAARVNISATTGRHVDRLAASDPGGAGRLGDPDLDREAERLPRPDRRRPPAPGARREAAAGSCSAPRRRSVRRPSSCSPRVRSSRDTCGSWNAGSARSSASSGPRSTCR